MNYTTDYVKIAVARDGKNFYFYINGELKIETQFTSYNDDVKTAGGFLTFNTPITIKNYSITDDADAVDRIIL